MFDRCLSGKLDTFNRMFNYYGLVVGVQSTDWREVLLGVKSSEKGSSAFAASFSTLVHLKIEKETKLIFREISICWLSCVYMYNSDLSKFRPLKYAEGRIFTVLNWVKTEDCEVLSKIAKIFKFCQIKWAKIAI